MGVDSGDIDDLIRDLDGVDSDVARMFRRAMQQTVDIAEGAVKGHTPVNTGALRQSVTHDIFGRAVNLTGEVFTPLVYGFPVEEGRRPGKPPPTDAIKLWVIRKLGKSGRDADSTAYLIARAIGKRGTKGAFMFEQGFDQTRGRVERIWDDVGRKIIDELTR